MKLVRANILLLFSALCLWAQPQPFFPRVLATPGDPSQILYGVYNGALVQSTDLGHTWTPLYITEPGLPQPPVSALHAFGDRLARISYRSAPASRIALRCFL